MDGLGTLCVGMSCVYLCASVFVCVCDYLCVHICVSLCVCMCVNTCIYAILLILFFGAAFELETKNDLGFLPFDFGSSLSGIKPRASHM